MESTSVKQAKYHLLLNLSKKLNYPLVKPERVTLVINHYCNLRCLMCDLWESDDNREMRWETARKVIDEMKIWGVDFLHLTGGEPLLHPRFFDIVNYAAEQGITTEVNTNAAFPEEMAEKILASSLDRLNISLDGSNARTHDLIRGKEGTFDKAMGIVRAINKNRNTVGDKPVLIITCTIMNQNLEELAALVNLARRNLFSGVSFGVVTSGLLSLKPGRDFKLPPKLPEYWVPPERYPILDEAVERLIKIKSEDPGIIHSTPEYLALIKDYFKMRLPTETNNCFAGFNNLHIDPSGNSGTCGGGFGSGKRPLWVNWNSLRAFHARWRVARCRKPCLAGCFTNTGADNLGEIRARLREARREEKLRT